MAKKNRSVSKEDRDLLVPMTQVEKATAADELARLKGDAAQLELAKAEAVLGYKNRIAEVESLIGKKVSEITMGIRRPVACDVTRDFDSKRLVAVRLDTGVVVEDRNLLPSELQGALPFPTPGLTVAAEGELANKPEGEEPKK